MSGHADRSGLLKWIEAFRLPPDKVFVVHGEDQISQQFAEELCSRRIPAEAPYSGSVFNLMSGTWEVQASPIRLAEKSERRQGDRRARDVFDRLLAAGHRLLAVISRNRGGANKDLAKFTDQINSLCDKWDR